MKYILPIICFIVVIGAFWVSGFDFNERGEHSAVVYCITVFFVVVGFILGCISDYDHNATTKPTDSRINSNPPPQKP